VEQTKNIVDNATERSFVIIDELGRGTSTTDGMIVAKTILNYISSQIKCLCLFTTHYHDIIPFCKKDKNIELCFMKCNIDESSKDIKFLYKFEKGVCPESYGINVAKLAGLKVNLFVIKDSICKRAFEYFENSN
jgi:DNA mismatch repair protein MSH6